MADAVPVIPAPPAVTPAPAAPPAVTPTVLTDTTDKTATAPATWPDDWRLKMAGGDEKLAKQLDRFASPDLVTKSWAEAQTKIRSGQLRPVAPGPDATAEDLTAWRKEMGIPETPAGYAEHLDKGLVIGAADKPMVDAFLAKAHAAGLDPKAVKEAVAFHYENQQRLAETQRQSDVTAQKETEDALRLEWGADYRRNINGVAGFLDTAPPGVKSAIMNARDGAGRPILSTPDVVKWLLGTAMEINPAATVVPGAGAQSGQGLAERKAAIEKVMRTDRRAYDRDPKIQAEYRDIIDAEAKLAARGRAA